MYRKKTFFILYDHDSPIPPLDRNYKDGRGTLTTGDDIDWIDPSTITDDNPDGTPQEATAGLTDWPHVPGDMDGNGIVDSTETANLSFNNLIDTVERHATNYEAALMSLEEQATSSEGLQSGNNPGTVNITDATVATTRVQLTQSLTEMAAGIAKNAADHTKGLGRKISG